MGQGDVRTIRGSGAQKGGFRQDHALAMATGRRHIGGSATANVCLVSMRIPTRHGYPAGRPRFGCTSFRPPGRTEWQLEPDPSLSGGKIHPVTMPYIIIDCPPAHGQPGATERPYSWLDLGLVPVIPSPLDLWAAVGIRQVIERIKMSTTASRRGS